jgi:transposase
MDVEELPMQTITTIGFDIAKSVFQVHGVDAAGHVVIRRQLKRRHVLAFFQKLPPCQRGSAALTEERWSQPVDATLYLKEKRWSV